ncbi:MAG: ATP-binding protein [Eggerthellaceae bacterium]|nr:ATP-binding protein [Eggerthellaceae bacterium]
MNDLEEHNQPNQANSENVFDYTYVHTVARVAIYDDLKMAPHVIEIQPAPTDEFIEKLASTINEQKTAMGGKIPYSAIREVSENFIHARFTEIVVSILDNGNTIRFCDQGPGITNKAKAQLPGFTSAIEPMKHYIRGVGSGLPLVKEYLDISNGHITIEDNLKNGAVVTISLNDTPSQTPKPSVSIPLPPLNGREKMFLHLFSTEGALGVTDLCELTGKGNSTVFNTLKTLEEENLIQRTAHSKRILTDYGHKVTKELTKQIQR